MASFEDRVPDSVRRFEDLVARMKANQRRLDQLFGPADMVRRLDEQMRAFHQAQEAASIKARLAGIHEPSRAIDAMIGSAIASRDALERSLRRSETLETQIEQMAAINRIHQQRIDSLFAISANQASIDRLLAGCHESSISRTLLPLQDSLVDAASEAHKAIVDTFPSTLSPMQVRAVTLEPYSSSRSIAIVAGVPDHELELIEDQESEAELDQIADELEARLTPLGPEFLTAYRGAREAFLNQGEDWHRHVSASSRELTEHLIRILAPDEATNIHAGRGAKDSPEGGITRKDRLAYIYREVASGEYKKMAAVDMEATLATFYPSNQGIHQLATPFSDKELRLLFRRMQGNISVLLAAADL